MVHKSEAQLPPSLVGSADLSRLIRELNELNESLLQLSLRQSGSTIKMPKTSQLMDQVTNYNKLNLLQETQRKDLLTFLESVRKNAPVMHMSFSSDPTPIFLEKLVAWLRKEIDPFVLLTIGLQPTIGAGCIVRTTNRYFDLSLKQNFLNKHDLLMSKLIPVDNKPVPTVQLTPPGAITQ
jgi:F0F1-type ATP synthase delta subunit